jgi:parallel beta-helix repeat protein
MNLFLKIMAPFLLVMALSTFGGAPSTSVNGELDMTEYVVKNSNTLKSTLSKAKGGDRILLAPGKYDALTIYDMKYASTVTIISQNAGNPAIFSKLSVVESKNISIIGVTVDFVPNATTTAWESAVMIRSSSGISVANSKIEGGLAVNGVSANTPAGGLDKTGNVLGFPAARGVTVDSSNNVTLKGNDISLFQRGVVLNKVDGATISKNEIHDLRMSPLAGGAVSNVLVEGNHFFNFTPWQFGGTGDHGDLVHFWTDKRSQASSSDNITIRNNFLEQGTGDPLLGIYIDDNANNLGFKNLSISNNLILNGNAQGIRIENGRGTVSNNTLVQTGTGTYKAAPGVLIVDKSVITLKSNIVGRITNYAGTTVTESDNDIVQRHDAKAANYYASVFKNALGSSPTVGDFALRANAVNNFAGVNIATLRSSLPLSLSVPGAKTASALAFGESFQEQTLASSAATFTTTASESPGSMLATQPTTKSAVFMDVSKLLTAPSTAAGQISLASQSKLQMVSFGVAG